MKRLIIPTLSLVLLAGMPAHAAPPDNQTGNEDDNAKKQRPQGEHPQGDKQAKPGEQKPGGQQEHGQQKPVGIQREERTQQGQPGGQQQGGAPRVVKQKPAGVQPQQVQQQERTPPKERIKPTAPGNQPPQPRVQQKPIGGQWQGGQQDHRPQGQDAGERQRRPQGQDKVQTERYSGSRDYTPGHRPTNWNKRPRQFDPRDYHHNYQAERRYRWNQYQRPRGWYERRWVFGEYMPAFFWARNYWIGDYWMFGLAIPPYGCEWVRYGNDALLIDTDSGEILQVVYGIFY